MGTLPCQEPWELGKEELRCYRAPGIAWGPWDGKADSRSEEVTVPSSQRKPGSCCLSKEREELGRGSCYVSKLWFFCKGCTLSVWPGGEAVGGHGEQRTSRSQAHLHPLTGLPASSSQIKQQSCWRVLVLLGGTVANNSSHFWWDSTSLRHFNHIFLVLFSPFPARETEKGTTSRMG